MRNFQLYKYRPITLALIFFVIAGMSILVFQKILVNRYLLRQEQYVGEYIYSKKSIVNSIATNSSIFAQAVSSYVEQNPNASREQFESFVFSLLKQDYSRDSLIYSLVCTDENFTINRVYPYDRQSFLLGTKLFEHTENEYIIDKTLEKGVSIMNGPLELKTGAKGLITSVPICTKDTNYNCKKKSKGLAVIIISFDKFVKKLQDSSLLRSAAPTTYSKPLADYLIYYYTNHNNMEVVVGDTSVLDKKPVATTIKMRGGRTWVVASAPRQGWTQSFTYTKLFPYYIVLVLTTVLLYFLFRNKRISISELSALNRIISENTGDTLWILDSKTMKFRVVGKESTVMSALDDSNIEEKEIDAKDILCPESYELLKEKIHDGIHKCKMGEKKSQSFQIEIQFYVDNIKQKNKIEDEEESTRKTAWGELSATFLPPLGRSRKTSGFKILGVTKVITDRKNTELELKENEEKFRMIAENLEAAVATLEPVLFDFKYLGPSVFNITGYTAEEILESNMNFLDFLLIKDASYVKEAINREREKFNRGEIKKINLVSEFQIIHKNQSLVWVELRLSSVSSNNKISSFVGMMTGIEDRKRIALKLEQQREKLKLLNSTKDRFFSIIAHDFKNPFAALLNMSELLVKYREKMTPEKEDEIINIIYSSTKFIQQLFDNLLQWSRASSGEIQYDPTNINLCEFINKTIEFIKAQAAIKNITIKVENFVQGDAYAYFDHNMIETVIRNIVSNAIKFSFEYSNITIRIENKNETHYRISISDEGVGIPEEKLGKLFKIGEKITTKGTKQESGTGLGLILCKEFIDKHNCDIWAHSEESKGSTFFFTLTKSQNIIKYN